MHRTGELDTVLTETANALEQLSRDNEHLVSRVEALQEDKKRVVAACESETQRLRNALEPFAAIKPSDPAPHAYWVVNGTPDRCSFTHDQLMIARELIHGELE